jgi:hypothetical protein
MRGAAGPCFFSLALLGSQARQPRLPGGGRLWAGGSGECSQTPHTGKDQKGRAATPATPATTRSPPQKEERETLRPVVASATEPGTWLFPSGPRRRERCGLCLLRMATAGVHREEASTQRERQRRQQVSTDSSSVLPFLGGGVRRPVVFAAGVGHCPVLVCWRGRRNHCCTKRAARAQPAARQPTTRGRAAPPATGFPAPPPKKPGETLQRAAAGVPRNGVPRQPSHTLHWNRRPKRSSGEAHSTRLSKPKHGPQKATDFGYRAGRFMRPLTRQNHHSGCSMLIGCDAHNQNTFRDPEKQKPPRPESG